MGIETVTNSGVVSVAARTGDNSLNNVKEKSVDDLKKPKNIAIKRIWVHIAGEHATAQKTSPL